MPNYRRIMLLAVMVVKWELWHKIGTASTCENLDISETLATLSFR